MMTRRYLIFLAALLLVVSNRVPALSPTAHKGVLDLRNWDFAAKGPVELRGDWEFHFGALIDPTAFDTLPDAEFFIGSPSLWKGVETGDGPAGAFGKATYRLRVLLPDNAPQVEVRIGDISGASRVFADRRLVAASGRIDPSGSSAEPDYRPVYFTVQANGQLEIVIHEVNLEDSFGGRLWAAGIIGLPAQIDDVRGRNITQDAFNAGLLFIFAAFFLVLYAFRRVDATPIIFALMCLGMCLYQISSGEHISTYVYPWIPYRLQFHIRWVVIGALPGLYTLLFVMIYPADGIRRLSKIFIGSSCGFTIACVLPMVVLTAVLPVFHLYALAVLIYLVVLLIQATIRKREEAVIFMIGLAAFLWGTINDVLAINQNATSVFLLPIGQIAFVFCWGVALSRRFARDYQRAERLDEWNQRLRKLDEAKTNFFANSSHELRTPLTLLLAPLDGIMAGRYGELIDKNHPIFAVMKRNALRLKRLADGLLDFLRMDAGTVNAAPKVIDLKTFVERIAADFLPLAQERGLGLEVTALQTAVVRLDPEMLETIVLNLLSNAVKFTPEGGIILIHLDRNDHQVVLTITDTGIGIAPDRLPCLFDRFSASSSKDRGDYSGFGIGLPLSAGLVRLMGGRIEVTSQLGKGSRFTIRFPGHSSVDIEPYLPSAARLAEELPPKHPEPDKFRSIPEADKPRLLVVEDDRDMAAFLADVLARNYAVTLAPSGPDAIRRLEAGLRPKAIVCDVMMPEMDGFELKQRLDGSGLAAGVPFMFLSAKADAGAHLAGLTTGAVDYIDKPFVLEELEAKLRTLIAMTDSVRMQLETQVLRAIRQDQSPGPSADWRDAAVELGFGERDLAIAAKMLEGLTDKEIASQLGYAVRTVSNRISAMFRLAGVANRTAMIAALHKQAVILRARALK